MCLAVYLASSNVLPPIAWDQDAPAFYLEPVPEGGEVHQQFSLPYVYYAGSHEGCGCGFSRSGETGEEIERHQANYAALARVLRATLSGGAKAELFTCWEGDQGTQPEISESVTPDELESSSFQLKELQFLRVVEDGAERVAGESPFER
jgi:hypothetical protein